jgi:hypothetical protein
MKKAYKNLVITYNGARYVPTSSDIARDTRYQDMLIVQCFGESDR